MGEGKFIQSIGKEYKVVARGREYHDFGDEYKVKKKGKRKQYHLLYNIKAVGKNIKLGRGEGGRKLFGNKD